VAQFDYARFPVKFICSASQKLHPFRMTIITFYKNRRRSPDIKQGWRPTNDGPPAFLYTICVSTHQLTEFTAFSSYAIRIEDFQSQNNRWFAPPVEFRAKTGAKLHIKTPSLLFFGKILRW